MRLSTHVLLTIFTSGLWLVFLLVIFIVRRLFVKQKEKKTKYIHVEIDINTHNKMRTLIKRDKITTRILLERLINDEYDN